MFNIFEKFQTRKINNRMKVLGWFSRKYYNSGQPVLVEFPAKDIQVLDKHGAVRYAMRYDRSVETVSLSFARNLIKTGRAKLFNPKPVKKLSLIERIRAKRAKTPNKLPKGVF